MRYRKIAVCLSILLLIGLLAGCAQPTVVEDAELPYTSSDPQAEGTVQGNTQTPTPTSTFSGASGQTAASTPPAQEATPKPTDKYKTDPVPTGKPTPVEPQQATVDKKQKLTCTISIRCQTALNSDRLDAAKREFLPQDGVILPPQTVEFSAGESVFTVLQRETRNRKIHMEFVKTPMYNSSYIEGIHNLYEFDCGELSGWMYRVNGWYPNYGSSRYQLQDGDVIEWLYTCDLGRDIGNTNGSFQGRP
jgi:hypothetical protein